jgi:hypothetical protein
VKAGIKQSVLLTLIFSSYPSSNPSSSISLLVPLPFFLPSLSPSSFDILSFLPFLLHLLVLFFSSSSFYYSLFSSSAFPPSSNSSFILYFLLSSPILSFVFYYVFASLPTPSFSPIVAFFFRLFSVQFLFFYSLSPFLIPPPFLMLLFLPSPSHSPILAFLLCLLLFSPCFYSVSWFAQLCLQCPRSTLKCVLFRASTQVNETWNLHGVRDGAPRRSSLEINHTAACPQSALSPRLMVIDAFTLVTLET